MFLFFWIDVSVMKNDLVLGHFCLQNILILELNHGKKQAAKLPSIRSVSSITNANYLNTFQLEETEGSSRSKENVYKLL